MNKKQDREADSGGLGRTEIVPGADTDARKLLQELQAHQIELEMQNEELMKARAAAEAAMQSYSELYDFAPAGYFSLDGKGAIRMANFAAAGILKVERAKLVDRKFGAFVAAASLSAFNAFMKKISGKNTVASCEIELVNAEGVTVFVLLEVMFGHSGDERHLAVMNITERKQLELKLMAARNNLDSILNAVPDLLFEVGLDGRYYNFWSPHTELLATSPETFLGKRLSDVLPPDTAEICLAAVREANEKKHSMGRQYELSLGGENRWFELSVARKDEVYADGPRFVALCRDITVRKQAEQDLRTLYTAIEQSPISVVITDAAANILYVNPRFTKVTGYASAEVVGKNPRMFRPGQALPEIYRDMWDKITHGQNWQGELLNRRKNGELYWEEIHIAPVTDVTGSIINYVCLMLDIDQRKKTEQVTIDLLWQNRALAKRMFATEEEERRKMSRELHDELGQWLTAIQAETEAINSISGNSAPIRASVAAINQSADAMHEVIRRMVHSLRPSMLDTLGLADSLHELERQWCQPRLGISCSFMLASGLEDLSDNLKITIFRLVQEALNNIASYAKANHVSVRLHREACDVPDTDCIILEIKDDGIGFDPARHTGGTGILGMRERTIAAGGAFALDSAPGQGVCINIRLPVKAPEGWWGSHDRRKK